MPLYPPSYFAVSLPNLVYFNTFTLKIISIVQDTIEFAGHHVHRQIFFAQTFQFFLGHRICAVNLRTDIYVLILFNLRHCCMSDVLMHSDTVFYNCRINSSSAKFDLPVKYKNPSSSVLARSPVKHNPSETVLAVSVGSP